MSPFIPFMTEELWEKAGYGGQLFTQEWPGHDADFLKFKTFVLVLQVNGKIRDKIEVELDTDPEKLKEIALENEKIKEWIKDKEIVKIIPIKNKLVNIVVKGQ